MQPRRVMLLYDEPSMLRRPNDRCVCARGLRRRGEITLRSIKMQAVTNLEPLFSKTAGTYYWVHNQSPAISAHNLPPLILHLYKQSSTKQVAFGREY